MEMQFRAVNVNFVFSRRVDFLAKLRLKLNSGFNKRFMSSATGDNIAIGR